MKKIILGKLPTNDIVIDHPSVSRIKHLEISVDEGNSIWITHYGSNDTIIDGIPIKRSKLHPEQSITIGTYPISGSDLIHKVNEILNKSKIDFTKEYNEIFPLFDTFEKKKRKIKKPSDFPKIMKIIVTSIVLIIVIIKTDFVPDTWIYPLIAGAGMIPAVFGILNKDDKKKQDKLDDLDLEYDDQLRCPKCRIQLTRQTSRKLKGLGKCFSERCDAIFSIE